MRKDIGQEPNINMFTVNLIRSYKMKPADVHSAAHPCCCKNLYNMEDSCVYCTRAPLDQDLIATVEQFYHLCMKTDTHQELHALEEENQDDEMDEPDEPSPPPLSMPEMSELAYWWHFSQGCCPVSPIMG
ncbi:hypothetical protein Pcinc_013601 [Petrolisthes cinctipes]|uniref:Uncharacterized protein n=1 Tax=Petrolisthes cinctipes TaxID=88211 RepID=A0AAE1FWN1_PETCI|nr:hypothetical protein Pcinc_013601 [Petrolisthes cinctipes]